MHPALSNHPRTIIKQLIKVINNGILDLSCNNKQYDKFKGSWAFIIIVLY